MNCENCGARIDKDEEYCPNCGMQLVDLPPNYHKKSTPKAFPNEKETNTPKSEQLKKPIKQKYMENPQDPDYSDYEEEYEQKHNKINKKSSESSVMINLILFIFIALALGFIVGIIVFGAQSIPLPGFKY